MPSTLRDVLVLAPCLRRPEFGGVQVSGRLAWDAVSARLAENSRLLCYGPDCARQASDGQHCARGKLSLACRALRAGSRSDLVLFWHLSMLRLLPLLGSSGAFTVLFLHGIECWRDLPGSLRRLLSRVHLFLTNSDTTWERFLERNPQCRGAMHQTVWLGIGDDAAPAGPPARTPAALMVGRMDRREDYKGHRELIRVWPAVLDRMPEAELWIAGDGNLRQELEAVAVSSGASHRVRFFGPISEEKKEQMLRECCCLALPSRGEGFGLVYLEAMRQGRPCLVSTVDAGREVVSPPEAGLAADPRDPAALADALCRLLTPGLLWQAWSAAARQRYEAQFTAARFQDRLLSALRGALA